MNTEKIRKEFEALMTDLGRDLTRYQTYECLDYSYKDDRITNMWYGFKRAATRTISRDEFNEIIATHRLLADDIESVINSLGMKVESV